MQRKRRQGELHVTLAAWKQEEKLRQRERSKSPERPKSADSSKNLYTHTHIYKRLIVVFRTGIVCSGAMFF